MLIFTSGTTGAPKAVRMSHGKLTGWGSNLAGRFPLTPDDVCYSAMPLFHSNAAVAGYTAPIAARATTVLRRRFSASGFLPDVREYGVTFFNYVGKPLTYILDTPARADDADSTLRIGFGNEAAPLDIDRFAQRFGCVVVDGYGSTEGGINMSKTDDTPPGSLGVPIPGFRAEIVDPDTGSECARARFDENGRLLNAEEAIGEIVNPDGAGSFEGYYNNPEANAERMRDGKYWTGDLGYRDDAGFFYFAGRNSDWLRVDGENFAAAPLEQIISRHPDVVLAAVYAVPSPEVGDEVMVALHLHAGTHSTRTVSSSSSPRSRTSRPSGCRASSASRTGCRRPPRRRCSSGCCSANAGSATTTCGGDRTARSRIGGSMRTTSPGCGPASPPATASTSSAAAEQ